MRQLLRNCKRRPGAVAGPGLIGLSGAAALVFCCAALGQIAAPNTENQVLHHLNLVVHWSRQWVNPDIYLARSTDELYIETGQAIAQKVVQLEFQSALAQAELIAESTAHTGAAEKSSSNVIAVQNMFRLQQQTGKQIQTLKASLDALNRKIPTVRASERSALMTQRDTVQGQLQLAQALSENLQRLTSFVNSADNASGAASELTAKILAMQRTVPAAAAAMAPTAAKADVKVAAASSSQAHLPVISISQNEGLVGQMGQLMHLMSTLRALDQMQDDSARLQASTQQLRAPLLTALRATLQQGQLELTNVGQSSGAAGAASTQGAASTASTQGATSAGPGKGAPAPSSTANPTTPEQKQKEMSALVQRFKQLSNATLPLSQELILVDQSQTNLKQLQDSTQRAYTEILGSLLLRVATLLVVLGLIWLFSELWRRATFRYVGDTRRRRQFLVLRRVITGFCMVTVIVLGFVSDFSSLATYAGLITAGVAVALQAVILSIAAYFFLVGRYGVRVGDRVTVVYSAANSVTGDVVDIGLVRFYLVELAGSGIEMTPTGRIVVFPNSVLFQTNPLFKQIPGTEYTWREIALALHPESEVQSAEKELLAGVNRFYAEYRPLLEKQHFGVEQAVGVHMEVPKPSARVRFAGAGLEVVVRYPIPLRQAAELDDRMVMEVMEFLRKNPSIRLADGSVPSLGSVVKV